MAEERIEILVTPERTNPKDGNLRRNSRGRTITSNSGEKVIPHYLRASTSSCHDFCKYGRRNAFEAKEKHPMPIRIAASPAKGQNPVKIATPTRRNMKPVIKPKPSPEPKTQVPDKPKIVKRDTKNLNKAASSPSKKIDVAAKPAISLKPKPVTEKSSLSPLNSSGGLNGRRNSDTKIVYKTGTSKIGEKKASVPPVASISPKPSVNRIASLSTSKYKTLKAASLLKSQNMVRKAEPMLPNDDKLEEKVLYVVEPKSESKCLGHTQNGNLTSRSSPTSRLVFSSPPSSPSFSSDEGEGQEDSEYTLSEENVSISDIDETNNEKQIETLKVEYKRPSRAAMVHPEDKDPPQKLKFRRGKVVNLHTENNGPKRLRFRQGRVLGDNQNGKVDVGRRSFRRKREVGDADTNGTKADSQNVVLRHQDVQGKKDAQGLFNNVIEETASKLVETRKSKVKALVGAFETVISLQDTKTSATGTA